MMRPHTMKFFDDLIATSFVDIRKAKKQGRKIVGCYCVFSPVEIIEAVGALPVGLCATKQESITDGERHLPRNLCPLIKSSYGLAITDKCPFFYFADVIVGETTCDGKKKMYELMEKIKPLIVLDIPNTTTYDKRKQHWIEEIVRLKTELEQRFNVELNDNYLKEVIRDYNQERILTMKLCALNKYDPVPFSSLDLLRVLWGQSFQTDRREYRKQLLLLITELESMIKADANYKLGQRASEKPRILVTGSPIGVGQEKVMQLIEEAGGQIAIVESCSGVKRFMDLVDESKPPIEALAEKYMDIPCSCLSPNPRRTEWLSEFCKEYYIDGVVDITLQACHTYNIESYAIKEYMRDKHDIPVIQIETDYSQSDKQQIKLRLDTFIEMLR